MPAQSRQQDLYEVEAIRQRRLTKGKTHYLIKWKGYSEGQNTWEGINHLTNVMLMIQEFDRLQPQKQLVKSSKRISSDKGNLTFYLCDKDEKANVINNQVNASKKNEYIKLEKERPIQANASKEQSKHLINQKPINIFQNEVLTGNHKFAKGFIKAAKIIKPNSVKVPKRKQVQQKMEQKAEKAAILIKRKATTSNNARIDEQDQLGSYRRNFNSIIYETYLSEDNNTNKSPNAVKQEEKDSSGLEIKQIRLLPGKSSDLNEYLVEYVEGAMKIFGTFELMTSHPLEFVTYLEKKAGNTKE